MNLHSSSFRMLCYGSDAPLPEQVPLRAGPLSMVYENGDLRYIRLGNQTVLLRVYWAVRDANWGTAPVQISNVRINAGADEFDLRYDARCLNEQHHIDFRAAVSIAGAADGTLSFELAGVAHSDFLRNRIGLCVLHPAAQAGCTCEITHVDGAQEPATLPKFIVGAQPVPPFEEMRELRVQLQRGDVAAMRFEGDTFEMEDQRNWTDASFKTFCTPLRLPFPVQVKQGEHVRQTLSVKIENAPAQKATKTSRDNAIAFVIQTHAVALPALGLGQAFAGKPLGAKQIARLKRLKLRHLRVDLDLSSPNVRRELRRAAKDAGELIVPLEVALFIDAEHADAQLAALRRELDAPRPKVARWLIYPRVETQHAAPPIPQLVDAARRALASYNHKIIFAAGTDADFIFANKQAMAYRDMDAFCMPTNPQTHAFDNASLVESLAAQGVLVKSAAKLAKGKPIILSPVTLKPRWNPYSTAGATKGVPPNDARQSTLFGAAWTLGSIKYLAEAGALSATYFETIGARGVMDRDVYPMWHVLADIGEFAGGEVLTSTSSEPLWVDGLVLRKGNRMRVLLANFTDQPCVVALRGLSGKATVKWLDVNSAMPAMKQPEVWRTDAGEPLNNSRIVLQPFTVARIDFNARQEYAKKV